MRRRDAASGRYRMGGENAVELYNALAEHFASQ